MLHPPTYCFPSSHIFGKFWGAVFYIAKVILAQGLSHYRWVILLVFNNLSLMSCKVNTETCRLHSLLLFLLALMSQSSSPSLTRTRWRWLPRCKISSLRPSSLPFLSSWSGASSPLLRVTPSISTKGLRVLHKALGTWPQPSTADCGHMMDGECIYSMLVCKIYQSRESNIPWSEWYDSCCHKWWSKAKSSS